MSRSINSLALKLAQVLEDHSEKDIRSAVDILKQKGFKSDLLEYMAEIQGRAAKPSQKTGVPRKDRNPMVLSNSRAVLRLKDQDPERFKLLSEFDLMVKRGQILASNEDLRRFGERISKSFEPKKSRKDTVSALMVELCDRSLLDIEKLIEFAATLGVAGGTDEYQRLAQFLIKGKGAAEKTD